MYLVCDKMIHNNDKALYIYILHLYVRYTQHIYINFNNFVKKKIVLYTFALLKLYNKKNNNIFYLLYEKFRSKFLNSKLRILYNNEKSDNKIHGNLICTNTAEIYLLNSSDNYV